LLEVSGIYTAIAFQFCKLETHIGSRHRSFVKRSVFTKLSLRLEHVQSVQQQQIEINAGRTGLQTCRLKA